MTAFSPNPIDKSCVARSFRASVTTYEDNAIVQKQVCETLLDLVALHTTRNFSRALEIGCGTGYLTQLLTSRYSFQHLYVNDLVAECCSLSAQRVVSMVPAVTACVGDIETLDLPEPLDLVASASTLQWMVDLPHLLNRLHQTLTASGVLALSLFGDGTMAEIQELTGRSLAYHRMEQLQEMIGKVFTVLEIRLDPYRIFFPSARAILRHIKSTGVGGLGGGKGWTASRLKMFEQQYQEKFATAQGLPVSYSAITVIAQKT